MSQDELYQWIADQDCSTQPEPAEDSADQFVKATDERIRRGQELTKILMANLRGKP